MIRASISGKREGHGPVSGQELTFKCVVSDFSYLELHSSACRTNGRPGIGESPAAAATPPAGPGRPPPPCSRAAGGVVYGAFFCALCSWGGAIREKREGASAESKREEVRIDNLFAVPLFGGVNPGRTRLPPPSGEANFSEANCRVSGGQGCTYLWRGRGPQLVWRKKHSPSRVQGSVSRLLVWTTPLCL